MRKTQVYFHPIFLFFPPNDLNLGLWMIENGDFSKQILGKITISQSQLSSSDIQEWLKAHKNTI